ncbi:class I SAM-dependent methyltransferase [Geminocystis sp. GBBB08]|uniref:class I SAM-dependent methyltransferase n=1 Tax=Geminocystis sp. GBBB08 TaxID=2604140 RepID=UPI0027E282CF|nr:class I SAM-dependent methyltransferase [Geminocystis sp. GBBB08]MBL1208534.1 class I SAM-dependent methyltransferase [Geminocystis sp. GBBB08]
MTSLNLEILICPNCEASLKSLDYCDNCKLEFSQDEGTPKLFPFSRHRTVQYEFNSDYSTIKEDILKMYVNDPPMADTKEKIPFHLDLAHAYVINQMPQQQKILEVGCGGGQMRSWVETKGHQYIGVDISKAIVFKWLQQFGGPDILCDTHFLPFKNQQFNLVYSVAVTEHLANPFLAVQEIYRVLKPGGYYLGNISFLEPMHDNSYFHLSILGVIELLIQAGFEIKYVWPERGYSGYHAIFDMGSQFTKTIKFIGQGV